jgi:hypothetical protein
MKIVGLGKAGCNLAQAFSKFSQYETYSIDTGKNADITIKQRKSHEEYDTHFPSLKRKLKFTNSDICVIICGGGQISGGSLRLLEQLTPTNEVVVLYIKPDLELASEIQQTQEEIVRNVLQEYARSGAIAAIWLIDNQMVEKGIGDVPISGYYDILNQAIVNTVHMIQVFKNSEPVIGNFIKPSDLSRIMTVGILDVDKEEEKWFYDLTNCRDVVYYYGINKDQLEEDTTLYKTITNYVKSKLKDQVNVSYGVFTTTYDQKYCYCIKYSSMVQSYAELLGD